MTSWTFETTEIANTFDSHVREQLPWYDMVTDAVVYITRNYLCENTNVIDIGASTGNMIEKLMPLLVERSSYIIGIEKSESMGEILEKKFANTSNVYLEIENVFDIDIPVGQVYILFLTLMFIPVSMRKLLLERIKESCEVGGVIIVVDKVCDHNGYFSTVLKRLTWNQKLLQGATSEDILKKEMSLAGVQIPIDPTLLGDAKQFFRMGEFAGWVIEV
jgi:tRNA (cmo5U34)-methyltransferase